MAIKVVLGKDLTPSIIGRSVFSDGWWKQVVGFRSEVNEGRILLSVAATPGNWAGSHTVTYEGDVQVWDTEVKSDLDVLREALKSEVPEEEDPKLVDGWLEVPEEWLDDPKRLLGSRVSRYGGQGHNHAVAVGLVEDGSGRVVKLVMQDLEPRPVFDDQYALLLFPTVPSRKKLYYKPANIVFSTDKVLPKDVTPDLLGRFTFVYGRWIRINELAFSHSTGDVVVNGGPSHEDGFNLKYASEVPMVVTKAALPKFRKKVA